MPKKLDHELESVHLKLFLGDKEILQRYYPKPIGYNAAVRALIRAHCRMLEESTSRQGETNVARTSTPDAAQLLGDLGLIPGSDG